MNNSHKETISIRIISCAFMVLAIAIFKPFGLEVWQWQTCVHLLAIFALGLLSCFLTEVILRYIVRMPRSYDRGVSYIISRNLRFQCINTPLVSLFICLYRHLAMSSLVEGNKLSLGNYLETLMIIAFLSFAIGLYWRFKFRSRYLAVELEETRQLNEQLKKLQTSNAGVSRQTEDNAPVGSTMLKRLGNAGRFGYPVLVVLNGEGQVVHIQDSGLLEEGKSYNQTKVLDFFKHWTPKAVNPAD